MKIVIAATGASGGIYSFQLLSFLKEKTEHEISLVVSPNARQIFKEETGHTFEKFDYPCYAPHDFNAPFVSGSAHFDQMVVVPCSMGTLARVACGLSDDVLTRTADVFLKEKRKLLLVPRETPFSLIHLENMRKVTLAGATVIPAIPSYYSHPKTIEALASTVTSRILDHMGIENDLMTRWGDPHVA